MDLSLQPFRVATKPPITGRARNVGAKPPQPAPTRPTEEVFNYLNMMISIYYQRLHLDLDRAHGGKLSSHRATSPKTHFCLARTHVQFCRLAGVTDLLRNPCRWDPRLRLGCAEHDYILSAGERRYIHCSSVLCMHLLPCRHAAMDRRD